MMNHRDALKGALVIAVLALGCSDATSASFASIRFSEQPAGAVAGEPMGFAIEFVTADGARATGVSDDVVVSLGTGETATGSRTVAVRSGIAELDDFVVTSAADDHVISASARGLTTVSLPFTVVPAEADGAHSMVATLPGESMLSNTPRSIVFTFADEFGNPIPRAEVSVTNDLIGATLNPTGGKTGLDGTFQTTYRTQSSGSAHFAALVNGLSIDLQSPLAVLNACTPSSITLPATMTGSFATEQGCLIAGQPFQFYQFTTASSGGVVMNIESAFGAEFEVRSDPAVPTVRLVAVDTTLSREWLLPAGSYEFRIGAFAGQGPYRVTAAATPANRGATVRILSMPGTFTGQTLDLGDFVNSLDAFTDSYAIYSSRPCTITVRSTAFDPYISLTNQFGISVGFDDNGGGGTDAQITRSSCISNGTAIRIDVSSVISDATGPYTLIVTYN